MIKLGFVSAVVADLGFEATIDLAAQYGYECVEMLCWPVGKGSLVQSASYVRQFLPRA